MGNENKDWKKQAAEYFFEGHLSIGDVSALTGVSRKSVSAYIRMQPGYEKERQERKQANAVRRREYKNKKNREYREAASGGITTETIRREHDVAAIILSREKYY